MSLFKHPQSGRHLALDLHDDVASSRHILLRYAARMQSTDLHGPACMRAQPKYMCCVQAVHQPSHCGMAACQGFILLYGSKCCCE